MAGEFDRLVNRLSKIKKFSVKITAQLGFSVKDFLEVEMVLSILEEVSPQSDAGKAYLLLCNYSVIGRKGGGTTISLLSKAHTRLRKYRSRHKWEKAFQNYINGEYDDYRLYCVEPKTEKGETTYKLSRNPNSNIPESGRLDILRAEIYTEPSRNKQKFASDGKYKYNVKSQDGRHETKEVEFCGLVNTIEQPLQQEEKGKREEIVVSVKELINDAIEIKKIYHDDYASSVLSADLIKAVNDGKVTPCTEININNVTNIVGMVGSGKTTFLKILAYTLAKRNLKIVIAVETVADIVKLYNYFYGLNISVSPLIGRSNRQKYCDQILKSDDDLLLPESLSQYLTAACILDGLKLKEPAVSLDDRPCNKLFKYSPKEDPKKEQYTKTSYICPYFNLCPYTMMQRQIYDSNIIITTDAGFASSRIGPYRELFCDFALRYADLVIFDECDRVQQKLDSFFAPETSYVRFVNETSDECGKDMRMLFEARFERLQNKTESAYYAELLKKSATILDIVSKKISEERKSWEKLLTRAFTPVSLLDQLRTDNENEETSKKLSDEMLDMLESLLDRDTEEIKISDNDNDDTKQIKVKKKQLRVLYESSCYSLDFTAFDDAFDLWIYSMGTKITKEDEIFSHIKLYIIVTRFDAYVNEMENLYTDIADEDAENNELYDFLRARFAMQQRFMPSSVIGNVFGMRYDKKKGLELFRQYAYGRALMTELPWLRMDDCGNAMGPHVLLLSGSSWAKGCLEYHVNCKVNYIIEAKRSKCNILRKARMEELGIPERVSGGGEKREDNLFKVIEASIDTIISELEVNDGKLLMIVNSYGEAESAYRKLNSILSDRDLHDLVAYMVKSEDTVVDAYAVPRDEIHNYDSQLTRILIAPASVIERGHNIVNKGGHSTFTSVFFLVRPMPVPGDISSRCGKINGLIAEIYADEPVNNEFEKASRIRSKANKQWKEMERYSKMRLEDLPKELKRDVVSSLFVTILQIYGRLARITDETKNPPRIYFADGAFRRRDNIPGSFDTLNELIAYLDNMMNSDDAEIAKALYQPFYDALKKGIKKNEYTNNSDDIYSEDGYNN